MKNIPEFEDFIRENASEAFKYHQENGLDLSTSVFRLGSQAYDDLFEETKQYWDKGNIILNGKSAWMAKNLEVGKKAKFETDNDAWIDVKLDTPQRGGEQKYQVYHNSGKKDDDGNIIATKIEWGDPNRAIDNADEGAASSFWARQQCDLQKKMDPAKKGFWACYGPSLFSKQLGLQSDMPW
jgi:hypothetical protein